jgi:hypothetical protein
VKNLHPLASGHYIALLKVVYELTDRMEIENYNCVIIVSWER